MGVKFWMNWPKTVSVISSIYANLQPWRKSLKQLGTNINSTAYLISF